MKNRIDDLPIRSKFNLLFLLGVLLPILVMIFFIVSSVNHNIAERERINAERAFDRVYSAVRSHLSSVSSLSNAVISDTEIVHGLNASYHTPSTYYLHYYLSLRPQITRYHNAYAQHVTAVELYSTNPYLLSGGVCMRMDEAMYAQRWYSPEALKSTIYVPYVKSVFGQADKMMVSLLRPFPDAVRYTHLLKIDLNLDPIRRAMEQDTDYLTFYLVAPDGNLVAATDSAGLSVADMRSTRAPAQADIRQSFPDSGMGGWQLCAVINTMPLEASMRQTMLVGIGLSILCALLALALNLLMTTSLIRRSKDLLWHMDNTTADTFLPINSNTAKDEIGELTDHFNAMSDRLKQLINDVYVLQLNQKSLELERVRGELKYLQAQVDPHFLFNTLNGILVVCVRNGYTELTEIIRALSKLMRRKVNTSHDTVALREEMEFVTMVLRIEQFRFGDKLRYTYDMDENVMDCQVPVMCVQGLVENACKHGVQHLSGSGMITVRGRRRDGMIMIDVEDNGVGMSQEQLDAVQQTMTSSHDSNNSIGLQNIYRRLVLHYGSNASLTLRKAEPQGTIASIHLAERTENHV